MNQQSTSESHHEAKKNVVIHALSMALGTLSSRVLGLVRDMAFAALFTRGVTDAWTTAFRLPNMFRRLLGEGSLSISFIPVFIEARLEDEKNGTRHATNLVNGFYTCLLLVLTCLTAMGIIGAEGILKVLLDPAYVANKEQFILTVRMAKIMFGFIFLMSHFAYFMGILNALGEYYLPAMAPLFFNIAMILSTFIPLEWLSSPGDGLAWGVVLGGCWQAGILVPALLKRGYLPKLTVSNFTLIWTNARVVRVFKSMLPGLLGTGLLQITTLINLRFASRLGEGPISYIYWADRLLELPLSLVAVSLGTALLPTLSKMWSEGRQDKLLETSQHYLRLNLFVCLPAAAGLFFLSRPIVEVLFRRGKFLEGDVQATSLVVSIYAFILLASSSVRVLVPLYYAMKNTWWPATAGAIALGAHIIVAPFLMDRWGLAGLVSSSLVSASLNLLFLALPVRRWVGIFGWWAVLMSFLKNGLASIAMGFLVFFINEALRPYLGVGELGRLLNLILSILVGLVFFVTVAQILRSEEMIDTYRTLKSKIQRRLRR
jgi:putative peptidoglycan lipid II flippase